jgi:hypothetical protein
MGLSRRLLEHCKSSGDGEDDPEGLGADGVVLLGQGPGGDRIRRDEFGRGATRVL